MSCCLNEVLVNFREENRDWSILQTLIPIGWPTGPISTQGYNTNVNGVRAIVIKHNSTYVYIVKNVLIQYATSLCTKQSFRRIFVTLRAAHIGELNQGLSSIQTFVRPNKRNDSRRRHTSQACVP